METIENYPDLWHYLSAVGKPIAVYGMGNGADKLFELLAIRGMSVSAIFASDEFVRGQFFRGLRVMKADEVFSLYPDCITLVAFGSTLPEVVSRICTLADKREVYIPDLPVAGDPRNGDAYFCFEFYSEHKAEFEAAREIFFDERSKNVFDLLIKSKLYGDVRALMDSAMSDVYSEIWGKILHPAVYRSFLDLGAYRGDTLRELISIRAQLNEGCILHSDKNNRNFLGYADFDFYAFEPDAKNYKKLVDFTKAVYNVTDTTQIATLCNELSGKTESGSFRLFNCAAWSDYGMASFSAGGNRNSGLRLQKTEKTLSGSKSDTVKLASPDDLIDVCVDYIKYDVEGAEYEALIGSKKLIAQYPELTVSAYHRPEDLYRLPLLLKELCPEYRLFLRRLPCIPTWEINIYAIK